MERKSRVSRKTNETDITIDINVDGSGKSEINTGIGFFDHMLELFARHGLFDLQVHASGDLHVDAHHTVEDVGIVLGQALRQAVGEKKSIKRYGTAYVPMDESLAMVVTDMGGRPFLVFDCDPGCHRGGEMGLELIEEFFRSVSYNAGMNIHIKVLYGSNYHHMIEAVFKAFGRALDESTRTDARIEGVMSTKGVI